MMPCTGEHLRGANPRMCSTCVRCGLRLEEFQRDTEVEQELTGIAGQAAGVHPSVVKGLDDYANSRAHDGPVRVHNRDLLIEAEEEVADCRSYLVWEAIRCKPGLLAGDHEATIRYDIAMRALAALQIVWRELRTEPR